MKKNLQIGKKIALTLALFLTVAVVNAQKTAVASGDWSDPIVWGNTAPPVVTDAVTISNAVTVNVNTTAVCASLTINGGGTASGLTFVGTNSLAVTNGITINSGTGTADHRTIAVGAGSLSCASVTMATTGNDDRANRITLSTGTVTVTGNITMNDADVDRNQINFTGAGTLNVGGSFTGGGVTVSTGTIRYTSTSGTQTIRNLVYNNLSITGAGTKSPVADTDVTGNVLVEAGSVLTLNGFDININVNASRNFTIDGTVNINGNGRLVEASGGTKTLVISSTGVLNITDNGGTGLPALNAYTFAPASIVNYGSTDNQTIENSAVYGNLVTSGTGTKTLETAGGTMTFAGGITIGNGTTLASNNKTINVARDFENNGTFTQGTSVVVFNGSVAQAIEGTTATTFNAITVNNTGAGLIVSRDLSISSTITMTDGIINTAATPNGLINILNGATVTGASTASHVVGPISKAGNTAFSFPVGSGTLYSPISITAPNQTTDVFQAEYVRASASAMGSISASGLTQVSHCEYWNLIEVADPGNDNSISVTVGWYAGSGCGSGYVTDVTKLTLAHFSGGTWSDHGGVASGNSVTGTLTRTAVTQFSPFALGSIDASVNPLPVSFTNVKAFEKGTGVQIEWTNLTESDISGYVVERSANGIDFTAIGQVAPRSNQADKASYVYNDLAPLNGTNFYRVKAMELAGKSIYTKSLRVDMGRTVKGISLYPNPVKGSDITVAFTAGKGLYTMSVLNTAGQVVYRQQMNHAGGTVAQQVSLPSLKAGMYNVLVSGDNFKETKMFVIQ